MGSAMEGNYGTKYLDRFIKCLECAPELLKMKIFPDAKEVTESMAAFAHLTGIIFPNSVHNHPCIEDVSQETRSNDAIVCIGDGSTPRSAALFALSIKNWECYSIDPQLKEGFIHTHLNEIKKRKRDTDKIRHDTRSMWESVPNLHILGERIQRVRIRCRKCIIVMIHCHLSFEDVWRSIDCQSLLGVLAIPCCNYIVVQQDFFGVPPSHEIEDNGIWSDKHLVRVWTNPLQSEKLNKDSLPSLLDTIVFPLKVDCKSKLFTSCELNALTLQDIESRKNETVEAVGEILSIRRFNASFFLFRINTNNMYIHSQSGEYYYIEDNSYGDSNNSLNPDPLLLRAHTMDHSSQSIFDSLDTLKKHALIRIHGKLSRSDQDQNLVGVTGLEILATNTQMLQAQLLAPSSKKQSDKQSFSINNYCKINVIV